MADGKDGERNEDDAAPAGRTDGPVLRSGNDTLPAVDSPPLSPADPEPELALERKLDPKPEPEIAAAAAPLKAGRIADPVSKDNETTRLQARVADALSRLKTLSLPSWQLLHLPRVRLTPRHRRRAVLAATVAFAAAFGAIVGSLVDVNPVPPAPDKAAQDAIAQLSREVAALKAGLAARELAEEKEVAEEKVAEAPAASPPPPDDITGSIPPAVSAPIPPPRPAGRIAASANRPAVVSGWTLRLARNGLFLVEGRGEIYQVVPGAPLPGLGPVQDIRRQDGRWTVITPRGLIVSRRDRRHFE